MGAFDQRGQTVSGVQINARSRAITSRQQAGGVTSRKEAQDLADLIEQDSRMEVFQLTQRVGGWDVEGRYIRPEGDPTWFLVRTAQEYQDVRRAEGLAAWSLSSSK